MQARGWAALPVAAVAAALALLPQCSPEELVYEPSGGGSAGDGSAGSGGTGTFDSGTWLEVCGNGIDDDQNGLTDCEDPSCPDLACVDLAPSGWSGPVALQVGPAGTLASCPKGLQSMYSGHADLEYGPASCGACSCGSPTSASCTLQVSYYATASCFTLLATQSVGTGCVAGPAATVGGVRLTANDSGSCGTGTAPPPTLTPPTWKSDVQACALAGGTPTECGNGKVCAPLFAQALPCVYQTGDVPCPAGFPSRSVYYGSYDDKRACSGCNCSFSATCTGTVSGFHLSDCATPTFSGQSPTSTCVPGDTHSISATGVTASNAACTPSGSSPSGCVAPATPTTFCCSGGAPCPSGGGPDMVQVPAAGGGSYCIDSTEVTRKQYAAFLATNPSTATQSALCTWNLSFTPQNGAGSADDRPVTYVDWCDAQAFCAWAGKRLCGKIGGGATDFKQPDNASESQWYNACSAGGVKEYAYGAGPVSGICTNGSNSPVKSSPCCVGGYPGIYDLSGGVDEWEDACEVQGGNPQNDSCLTRGGRCDQSDQDDRDRRSSNIGFRCCSP